MANWSRAFDELGTGLLRQADIGGRAYEGAMSKEAEQRAESRALSAERRAKTELLATEGRRSAEWDRQQLAMEQAGVRKEGRDATTFTQRLGEEATAKLDLEDKMITKRYKSWKKQYDIEATAKLDAAKDKAKITALKLRYEKAQSAYESLVKEFGDDPTSEGFKYAYRAQQDALQAWNDFSQASGLKMQVNPEIDRLRLHTVQAVYAEIVSADLQQDEPWKDFVKALQEGYGPGNEPNKASEDAMQTINEAIERLGIVLPAEEKSAMVDDLVKAFLASPNIREGTVEIGDPDSVDDEDGVVRFSFQAGDPLDRIDIENLEVGAFKEALANQGRPGKPGVRGTEGAQWRDPEWLLPRLETELKSLISQRDSPSRGGAGGRAKSPEFLAKIARVEALILKMKTLIDEVGPVVDDKSDASLMMVPQRGMINAVDQGIPAEALAYWEPDVADARAKSMQRTV